MSNQPMTNYTPAQADRIVRSMTVERTKIAELEAERDHLLAVCAEYRERLDTERGLREASEQENDRLRGERDALKDRLYCNCAAPYLGCQIIGSPTRCERCLKEVGEQGPTLRKENSALRAQVARLSGPVSDEEIHMLLYSDGEWRGMRVEMSAIIASRTAPAKEPEQSNRWVCETCHARYAEYVNGCPKCWANGEKRSGVRHQPAKERP